MKCPRCYKAIPKASTKHPECGWGYVPGPDDPQRQVEHQLEQRMKEKQAETAAFMLQHGLKTVEDCKAFVRKKMREMARVPAFERWCRGLQQKTVDYFVVDAQLGSSDARRLLRRFQSEGVIDEQHQLIPLEQREARRKSIEEDRRRVAAELEERRRAQVAAAGEEAWPA